MTMNTGDKSQTAVVNILKSQGVPNFSAYTARKSITNGFATPHEERFNPIKNPFPEILTQYKQ